MGEKCLLPAGVEAIMELFRRYDLDPEVKHWVVAGSTNWLGKPLIALLANMNVRVTFCSKDDPEMPELVKEADVLCTELFRKHAVTADMVKPGVIVIDNGNNYEGKKVYGDVDTDASVRRRAPSPPSREGWGRSSSRCCSATPLRPPRSRSLKNPLSIFFHGERGCPRSAPGAPAA